MVITHVAVALLLTVPVAFLAPEVAAAAAAGAVAGGIFPDLDLFVGEHRRTLHFPVVGPAVAAVAAGVALARPAPATVALAAATAGAGVHAASDVLGAGEELRPWERTNPFAVYDHVSGRWWRARYLIPYDGSPRDLLASVLLALPSLAVYEGTVRWLLVGLLVLGVVYTLVRRDIVPYVEELI
jgi:hypothetical protein